MILLKNQIHWFRKAMLCLIMLPVLSGCITTTPTTKPMVVAAHPLATKAGHDTLLSGGNAVDAAIAIQLVLGLVEPQSSGIGGGAFMLHYNNATQAVASYDGRETAPMSATPTMFLDSSGKPRKFYDAVVGGLGVGVPGVLSMLELAHKEHGKLPWKQLFGPAILLAEAGFPLSPRLAGQIARDKYLKLIPGTVDYFYQTDGSPNPAGTTIKNPEYANVLRAVSEHGAKAFYRGEIAESIVKTVQGAIRNPGGMTLNDLANYQAKKRPAVCAPYKTWRICGMGPPSSGGLTTLQILGILQNTDLADVPFGSAQYVHLVSEASSLAFADRNHYMADADFIDVPSQGLLNADYLKSRAKLIDAHKAGGKKQPGIPQASTAFAPHTSHEGRSTTHMSIIDAYGNAVSMTSSVENAFGSRLMSNGFILNNQLTDFSFRPEKSGLPVANRAEPGKRPRSSMSPTIVLNDNNQLVMVIGSPGGSRIIGYVTKTILATLDGGLDMTTAVAYPHFINRNGTTDLEKDTPLALLKGDLEGRGHKVNVRTLTSGLNGILITPSGPSGGADPRREGVVIGE